MNMKKFLLSTVLFLLGCGIVHSQSWRRVGNWGNQFTDIEWVNEEVGFIAGENILLKTIDGGLSWVEQEAPTDHLMLSLDFYDEEHGLVVGQEGMVYRTSNGGESWQILNLGVTSSFKDVSFVTREKVYITGNQGMLYRSEDGGQNWSREVLNSNADFNSLYFVNSDSGYIRSEERRVGKECRSGWWACQ